MIKWGLSVFFLASFFIACKEGRQVKAQSKGLSVEKGIDRFPLGHSVFSLPNFPLGDTTYDANWLDDPRRFGYASRYSRLWNYWWGDFSYYASKDGYLVFFKRGIIFAHLINSRGPDSAFDLKNGIHIGMPLDSMIRILRLPKSEPSHAQIYVTDSLAVAIQDYKVTSYCILSPKIRELFCAAPFNGAGELIKRSMDTASTLGIELGAYNSICIDEERDRYRIQFENGSTKPYMNDYRAFKFVMGYSTAFWFDRATKKIIRYHKPEPDKI